MDGNIGNVHPMRLGKALIEHFPCIRNIKKLGKNIIVVNFKFSFDVNQFAQSNNLLPENWISYIPNYKIIRTGIARGVDPSLSVDEVLQGIKWRDRPLEIKSVERLRYRDVRNNNELKISTSVKIEFVSNLLPYINIWSVRTRVRPFVNRVRKCYNCLRWGHSSAFCRGSSLCPRCGEDHDLDMCPSDSFLCSDCKQNHVSFDNNCLIYLKYELINTVMAFCNVSQFIAKRLIKKNNISSRDQVERVFRSSAYLAWDSVEIGSIFGSSEFSSTPSNILIKAKNRNRQEYGSRRNVKGTVRERDRSQETDIIDSTIIPTSESFDIDHNISQIQTFSDGMFINNNVTNDMNNDLNLGASIDSLFPSPGIVMKDLYEIYKSNRIMRERDSAVLNYLNLLFRNKN